MTTVTVWTPSGSPLDVTIETARAMILQGDVTMGRPSQGFTRKSTINLLPTTDAAIEAIQTHLAATNGKRPSQSDAIQQAIIWYARHLEEATRPNALRVAAFASMVSSGAVTLADVPPDILPQVTALVS